MLKSGNAQKNSYSFREEEQTLNNLISNLKTKINASKLYCQNNPRVADIRDYEDVEQFIAARQVSELFEHDANKLRHIIDNPYYGRLDLEINGEFKTVYIGQNQFEDEKSGVYVCSGYSPIGRFFAQKSLSTSNYQDTTYNAFLRRNILIVNGVLQLVDDVFVKGLVQRYSNVTDPFLMEVLRRNRRNTYITSILPTIQEKQYSIIDQDSGSSFVVQGCAGSGKTAIIFQRLANIEYHNPGYISSSVRLITPNEGFNEFIGPLAASLGLNKIHPLTMTDYYIELAKRYDIDIPVKNSEISDDYELNSNFLRDVYSDQIIYESIIPVGQKYINDILSSINYSELASRMRSIGIAPLETEKIYCLPLLKNHLYNLRSAIRAINLNGNKENEQLIQKAQELLTFYYAQIGRAYAEPTGDDISSLLQQLNSNIADINIALEALSEQTISCGLNYLEQISNTRLALQRIKTAVNKRIIETNNEIVEIKLEYEKIDAKSYKIEIDRLQQELNNLQNTRNSFPFLFPIRRKKIQDRISEIERSIEKIKQDSIRAAQRKQEIETRINLLSAYKTKIDINSAIEETDTLFDIYQATALIVENREKQAKNNIFLTNLPRLDEIIEQDKLSFKTIYKNIMLPLINSLCAIHNIVKNKNSLYIDGKFHTFNLYLLLTAASVFLPRPAKKDKLIIIDEAQEYSSNEFALIMEANSSEERPIPMNIFGDLHQKTSPKGITEWGQIPYAGSNIFELKENYRNSKEIVDFTNRELKMSDIAIGIKEDIPVKLLSFDDALLEISKGDICIIITPNNPYYEKLNSLWNTYDPSKNIIMLSPILSKGREFAKVIDNM